jgi:hypothetical protein
MNCAVGADIGVVDLRQETRPRRLHRVVGWDRDAYEEYAALVGGE